MASIEELGYDRTRSLLLAAGVAVLVVTAVVTYVRGVDPVEVLGVLLFLPVFVAAVLRGLRGGLLAGLLAALAYVLLRAQSLPLQTFSAILPTVSLRVVGYLVFGGLGGWASGVLGSGIEKLERFDVTDGDSELLNARGLHRQLDQELARARRYGSAFAVVTVAYHPGDHPRARRAAIGEAMRSSVRSVDDIGRVTLDGRDLLVAVLPETPAEGAQVVGSKIMARLHDADGAEVAWLTNPEDGEAIDRLLADLKGAVERAFPGA